MKKQELDINTNFEINIDDFKETDDTNQEISPIELKSDINSIDEIEPMILNGCCC